MKIQSYFAHALIAGTTLALSGCAADLPQTRVTRFHLGQPIAPGDVAVEPRNPTLAKDLEFQNYAQAVETELVKKGFKIAPNLAKSELVAVTMVARSWMPVGAPRSPLTIGLGGSSFGGGYRGGVGIGGGISFPVGKPKQRMDVVTELSVQLKRRSEGTVIWEGRAQTEARDGTPYAAPAAAVAKLAEAMFRDFPGPSGQTITVK